MNFKSVAIDGPTGAGKSTLAKQAAEVLGYVYVDTGAIYRTVALFMMEHGLDFSDGSAVERLLSDVEIQIKYAEDGLQHMYLCGKDVTDEIRLPEVSANASKAAAIPAVRSFLLEMQRQFAHHSNVVMDGRDIGTVVLPDADVKIFLTASAESRAKRRYDELIHRGTPQEFNTVLAEVIARDERDSNRDVAPLKPAEDGVTLDTTILNLDESLEELIRLIKVGV